MNNNKNRQKDRPKTNTKLRKIKPKENSDLGIAHSKKIGLHQAGSMEDNA